MSIFEIFILKMKFLKALVNCYECVPASFFDESFIFNFQSFSRNIKRMNEIQENVCFFEN